MRGRFLLLLALLLAIGAPLSDAAEPSAESQVRTIRARYAEIKRELKQCRRVKRNLPDESAEGGELTAYFKDASLRMLSARIFGESGRALAEYYFWDDRLFFVLRTEVRYDNPLSRVVKSTTEERFYFADGALIRWLNGKKKEVALGPEAIQRGRELLGQAKQYSVLAAKDPAESD